MEQEEKLDGEVKQLLQQVRFGLFHLRRLLLLFYGGARAA